MNLLPGILVILTVVNRVQSIDLNSLIPRTVCFQQKQPNCNKDLIDAYPELSKSVTNATDADTFFLLFTRRNPHNPEKLHRCAGNLPPDSNFNPEKELIMILTPYITGFCDVAVYRETVIQLLERDDYNIIAVDYSWGNHLDYGIVVLNLKIVAKQAVIVLENIQIETGISRDKILLVGHSLGGHLAGFISKGFRVGRIIALDPAGPSFDKHKTAVEDRLDISDADLVETWHTNAGKCLPNFGTIYDYGHINFYVNGGSVQAPCVKYFITSLLKGDFVYALINLPPTGCYHSQSTQYFKVSINPGGCQFVGVKCRSYSDFKKGKCNTCGQDGEKCLIMGLDTAKYLKRNISKPEKYYVKTINLCPYCDNSHIKFQGFTDTYKCSLQDKSNEEQLDSTE